MGCAWFPSLAPCEPICGHLANGEGNCPSKVSRGDFGWFWGSGQLTKEKQEKTHHISPQCGGGEWNNAPLLPGLWGFGTMEKKVSQSATEENEETGGKLIPTTYWSM